MFKGTLGVYRSIFKFFSIDVWLLIFLVPQALISIRSNFNKTVLFYCFFCLIVLIIFVIYILFDYRARRKGMDEERYYRKKILLVILLIIVFLSAYLFFIGYTNSKNLASWYSHDEIIFTEKAMENLVQRRNPYIENYFNLPSDWWAKYKTIIVMENIKLSNPALLHYAYLPAQFIVPFPLYLFLTNVFNFYDQRIFYFLCLLIILFLLCKLVKDYRRRLLLLILFFFFPFFFYHIYYGFNDLQTLVFLIACLYFLKTKKIFVSVIFLALAVASKQTGIFFIPFYLIYLIKTNGSAIKRLKKLFWPSFLLIFVAGSIILPFIIWDKKSFIDDIFSYPSGKSTTSYPINGWGFSRLIYGSHLVKTVNDYYPFLIWQAIFTIPLVVYLIFKQLRDNNLRRLILNYALALSVFWFFSRYFLTGHIIYIGLFLPLGYFIEVNKENKLEQSKI